MDTLTVAVAIRVSKLTVIGIVAIAAIPVFAIVDTFTFLTRH